LNKFQRKIGLTPPGKNVYINIGFKDPYTSHKIETLLKAIKPSK
jgi:hypothetical protein